MSISHVSIPNRDPAAKDPSSIYPELVHADESEILSWAVKTAISDLGTGTGHTDNLAMRQDLHERKRVLLMLLNRLMYGWTPTNDP
jgi:hypothetical protein